MGLPVKTLLSVVTMLLVLATAGASEAADQKAIIDKIKAAHQAAITAFGAGDFAEMKTQLLEAGTLGKKNDLANHPIMAQTYILYGVLQVTGLKDPAAGAGSFAAALEINPAAQVPANMTSKAVRSAFAKAENGDVVAAPAAAVTESKAPAAEAEPAEAEPETPKAAPEKKLTAAEKAAAKEAEKKAAAAEKIAAKEAEKAEKKAAAEEKELTAKEGKEKEKLQKELAAAKEIETKERAEKEKLQKEKQDKDKQIGDVKGRIAQLEKDKAEKDKQLAAANESLKKEREAKEKAEKERADRDKQLADAKNRIQQLEKEKGEKEKQLAAVSDSAKKEREAREKLDKARQEAEAREKERKGKEEQEKLEKQKLADGPDKPSRIPEPVYCNVPDEVHAGEDLYVHCAIQPSVTATGISFYYRPSNSAHYNAVTMDVNKKGWHLAVIPGNKITGKSLHYYVEARGNGKNGVAARNGKDSSPNILTVKAAGSPIARSASAASGGKLQRAKR